MRRGKESPAMVLNREEQCSTKNAQRILLRLKNRRKQKKAAEVLEVDDVRSKYSLKSAIISMIGIVFHWIILIVIASLNLANGNYYFGALALFFQFGGGLCVTFNLNVLMSRKGDKEFEDELRKYSPILLGLMYVPSFLPFFSCGLAIHLARKLRTEKDEEEIKRLVNLCRICEERLVTEQLYESSFSAFPLGVMQVVTILELTRSSIKAADYVIALGFASVWKETSSAPMRLARIINGHNPRAIEGIAGFANKGVTLLSFAFWIAASRRYFADLEVINQHLIITTIATTVVVLLVADSPGCYAFTLEMRQLLKLRIRRRWEFVLDLITFLVPLCGITFWVVALVHKDQLGEVVFILPASIFVIAFAISMFGFFCYKNLPWLGQFSTDVILLGYIAIESYFRGYEFHDIDFTYEPQKNVPTTTKNDEGSKKEEDETA